MKFASLFPNFLRDDKPWNLSNGSNEGRNQPPPNRNVSAELAAVWNPRTSEILGDRLASTHMVSSRKARGNNSESVLIARIDPRNPTNQHSSTLNIPQRRMKFSNYKTIEFGKVGTLQHRILFRTNGWQDISPWHNIPLFQDDGMLTFICTTPRGEWTYTEAGTNENFNPLRIKKKDNKPSHFARNLPHNYGFLPQTSIQIDSSRKEPIRIFDVGLYKNRKPGDVYSVKPVVAFLVADEELAMSWHIVAIDSEDTQGSFVSNLKSLDVHFPGALDDIASWLVTRNCLKPGEFDSVVALGGKPADCVTLMKVIIDAHAAWNCLYAAQGKTNHSMVCFKPLLADELEQLWRFYTVHESTECIEVRQPCNHAPLKGSKVWEYEMEEKKRQAIENLDVFEEFVISETQIVISRTSVRLRKYHTVSFQTLKSQDSTSEPFFKALAQKVFSPRREERKSKGNRADLRPACFFTPPRKEPLTQKRVLARKYSVN